MADSPEFPHVTVPFEADDLRPLDVEKLASQMHVSRAFIRLCIAAGCPLRNGLLSAAELLQWLFCNYDSVRELSGLIPLPPVADGEPTRSYDRMANGIVTLLEFGAMRAFHLEEQQQLTAAMESLKRTRN